jgi:hypothetical protein
MTDDRLMTIYRIDPIADSRWSAFVEQHPQAGVFHTPAWLQAIHRTYRYRPIAYVASEEGELVAGIPFCLINSCFTGRRLVSLPFSDHCEPLAENPVIRRKLIEAALEDSNHLHCKYTEIRPLAPAEPRAGPLVGFSRSYQALIHLLDLRSKGEDVLLEMEKRRVRKISRSKRDQVQFLDGNSGELLDMFYPLYLLTRRRHRIPPQPSFWFRNLADCLGDHLRIRVALKGKTPIAAIITLSFRDVVVYKYGCSDPAFHDFGGPTLLLHGAIRDALAQGATSMDMGRTDFDNQGLIAFKSHWGAQQSDLGYYRSPSTPKSAYPNGLAAHLIRSLLTVAPDAVFSTLGRLLYRHVG